MTNPFPEAKYAAQPALEQDILAWWDTESIFRRTLDHRRHGPAFTFYEGPPTANGRPGIHHVLGRTIKDVFCRYKTLKGYRVDRKAGWDTHGLPVEIEVERELGLDGREQVEDYGIAAFNRACRDSVARYKKDWDELTRRIGYWVDLEQPYVTFHTSYIETVWWLLKRMYERGLLYRGYKIQWYSPGTGTVLSSHEVSLGYKEITDPSAYVRFRVKGQNGTSLLAWTTTPWTLVSNVGLAVGPDIEYAKVKLADSGEVLILATARLDALKQEHEVLERCAGRDLVGLAYEPLYVVPEQDYPAHAWQVVAADYVSTDDGTGIVHIAPAFGAEDYEVGQKQALPLVNPIGPDGKFVAHAPLVAGLWFRDANRVVNRDLQERGLLLRQDSYLHNYPHDWRKGTPLMSYPVESWFIRTTARKDRLIDLNKTVNWYPPSIRDGRFGNWLENNVDWALSRKRYWGTPLPIWVSDAEGSEYFEVIGSIDELRQKCGGQLPPDAELDLHRPFVDELSWPAPDGGTMRRVSDVLDVWFDSGAMPFAQWHYPFENKEAFERSFPADFICEGIDQTRGWFYTLHAIATLTMDDVAFKNVVVNGLILDEKGEKMSKSKKNTIDPFATVDEHGADVVRWYMMSNSPPWDNMRFSLRGLAETRSKFFSTLENVYRFMASYANIDGFRHEEATIPLAGRKELDCWIVSRLNTTVAIVDEAYGQYDATRAARALETFVDELSNWYIRRSRPRFWAAKKAAADGVVISEHDKLCAYQTTYECLSRLATMISPIAPFFAEWLFRSLDAATGRASVPSVHMTDFPAPDRAAIDEELERRMGIARTIVSLVLLLRNKCRINVRQPLARIMVVAGAGGVDRALVESMRDIILEELNVRELEFVENSSAIVKRSAKADFKKLGPRLGKKMKTVAARIAGLGDADLARLIADGRIAIEVDGERVELGLDDVDVVSEEIGEWLVAQEGPVTVALDTHVTEELIQQGFAREVVNRIQKMRKTLDLALTDRIAVNYQASPKLDRAIAESSDYLSREVLATALGPAVPPAGNLVEVFEIGEETVTIGITPAVPSERRGAEKQA
ncbi:MAG: isoleucine--tRNA ligase [Gammaproteobacteria bacterium]|nr:isoleucine--tRNA ligase [Gammaproteobacteria bacterium]